MDGSNRRRDEFWDGYDDTSQRDLLSERPFELFIESVQDYAIFMLDPGGHVMTWNQGAERIKGYRTEEIVGQHFSIFYTDTDRAREHPQEVLAEARREGHFEEEAWRVRKDGSRFWANVVITTVRDPEGRVIGFGKVTRDLTEQKLQEERERELRREQAARMEAEAASRAKSEFLAAMSHELRTPLNAILGYVDLMEAEVQGPLTDDQRTSLHRLRKSSKHLFRLINDVLNFTRVNAGRVDYDVRDVPVRQVLDDVEPLVLPQLEQKGIAFTCTKCEEGILIRADPVKVRQILLNLLNNARKYTEEGGAVSVQCDVEDSRILIHVQDTGRGISSDQQESIFEPFVQVRRHEREESQKGVGLGLAISRNIARAMEGDLTVESELGGGSTFTLELPASPSPRSGS